MVGLFFLFFGLLFVVGWLVGWWWRGISLVSNFLMLCFVFVLLCIYRCYFLFWWCVLILGFGCLVCGFVVLLFWYFLCVIVWCRIWWCIGKWEVVCYFLLCLICDVGGFWWCIVLGFCWIRYLLGFLSCIFVLFLVVMVLFCV